MSEPSRVSRQANPWLNLETQQLKSEVSQLQRILQEINESQGAIQIDSAKNS